MKFSNKIFAGSWCAYAVKKQHMDAVAQWFPCMQASVWPHSCWPLPLALLASRKKLSGLYSKHQNDHTQFLPEIHPHFIHFLPSSLLQERIWKSNRRKLYRQRIGMRIDWTRCTGIICCASFKCSSHRSSVRHRTYLNYCFFIFFFLFHGEKKGRRKTTNCSF